MKRLGCVESVRRSTLSDEKQDNILFGAPYDEERYKKGTHLAAVIQCFFVSDLMFYQLSTSAVCSVTSAYSTLEI